MVNPIMAGIAPMLNPNSNPVQNNTSKVPAPEAKSQPADNANQVAKTKVSENAQAPAVAASRGEEASQLGQQNSSAGDAFGKGNQVDLFA